MPDIQQQLTELRQQNEQLLEELRTLTGEFRAFRAEVMQEQDPYQFAYFYPGISHEQKEQVVQRLQQAVRGGSRDILITINQLENEHLIRAVTIPALYRELHHRFGFRASLSALKNMHSRMRQEQSCF